MNFIDVRLFPPVSYLRRASVLCVERRQEVVYNNGEYFAKNNMYITIFVINSTSLYANLIFHSKFPWSENVPLCLCRLLKILIMNKLF